MSFRKRLRTVLACLILETGVLLGAPIRMEQVDELLRALSQPKLAQTDPEEAEKGGPGQTGGGVKRGGA